MIMKELKCCKDGNFVEITKVAFELGISVQAVHQYLKRKGVSPYQTSGAYRPYIFRSEDVQEAYRYWTKREDWS